MSAHDNDDAARREAALVDAYLRHYFRVEPALPESTFPTTESGERDEDEQFAAYMQQHFPAAEQR